MIGANSEFEMPNRYAIYVDLLFVFAKCSIIVVDVYLFM